MRHLALTSVNSCIPQMQGSIGIWLLFKLDWNKLLRRRGRIHSLKYKWISLSFRRPIS
jgi:hypothetical protein